MVTVVLADDKFAGDKHITLQVRILLFETSPRP